MLTTRLLGVTTMIGLALAIAGVARSPASEEMAHDGKLVVREHQLPSDGVYIEGYVSFLRVRDLDTGHVVAAKRSMGKVHLRKSLPPGFYRVVRFIRPCDGNCGYLDPKTERCATTISIRAGDRTRATVRTRTGHRCEIRIRS